jgi:L-fuconolactonase
MTRSRGSPRSEWRSVMHPAGAIDAHCHVWLAGDGERFPMRAKIPALARDFTFEELASLQEASGMAGTVHVQAVDSAAESLRLLAQADAHPRILGVVAWADSTRDDFVATVESYRGHAKFVGIRPMPHDVFGGDWLDATPTRRALAHLRDIGCCVDLLVQERDLERAERLVRDLPGLRCVLNHAGRPAVMAGDLDTWRTRMRALARLPSLYVKCSGLTERAGVEWTPARMAPWIRALVEIFGDARVMFGSNWPVITLACRYDLWVDTVRAALVGLGTAGATLDRVMRGNAAGFYGLASTSSHHGPLPGGESA